MLVVVLIYKSSSLPEVAWESDQISIPKGGMDSRQYVPHVL